MKKYICLLLALLLGLSLVSCGSPEHEDVVGTISGLSIHGDFRYGDDDDSVQGRDSRITLSEKPTESSDQTETGTPSDHSEPQPAETQQPSLCLDNDAAGMTGMERLEQAIRDDPEFAARIGLIYHNSPPKEYGKDYNEFLCAQVSVEQAQRHHQQARHGAR